MGYATHIYMHAQAHIVRNIGTSVVSCACVCVSHPVLNRVVKTWVTFSSVATFDSLTDTCIRRACQATGYSNDYKIYQSLFHICHTHARKKNEKKKSENSRFAIDSTQCTFYSIDLIVEFCEFSLKKPTLFHKNERIEPEIL